MGEVYRARDTRLGREVAIKVLPGRRRRATPTASRASSARRAPSPALNHPNIVILHSIEDEDGIRFLTMELVEGESLDRSSSPGGLPLARVLELAIALADALAAAHERGVVHRDLKPANVMVTPRRAGQGARLRARQAGGRGAGDGAARGRGRDGGRAALDASGRSWAPCRTWRPSRCAARRWTRAPTCSRSASCSTSWPPGAGPFTGATSADVSSAILRDAPPPLHARARRPAARPRAHRRAAASRRIRERRFQTALDVLQRAAARAPRARDAAAPAPARPAASAASVASIAVLPFVNRSADADDEYFSDGLADELLNVLAKIRGLRVAARTSSFHVQGQGRDASPRSGRRWTSPRVLEGSVRKSGNRVRISVQLVNVADGYHLWSETYDRTLEDIFAVQDDIAQSVVKELRTTLLGEAPDSEASGEAKAEVAAAARGRGSEPRGAPALPAGPLPVRAAIARAPGEGRGLPPARAGTRTRVRPRVGRPCRRDPRPGRAGREVRRGGATEGPRGGGPRARAGARPAGGPRGAGGPPGALRLGLARGRGHGQAHARGGPGQLQRIEPRRRHRQRDGPLRRGHRVRPPGL